MSKVAEKLLSSFSLSSLWKLTDLRDRLLFTFFAIVMYRLVAATPLPGVMVTEVLGGSMSFQSSWLGMFNSLSGGALSRASVGSLGLMPYINASLFMYVWSMSSEELKALRKEGGEAGRAIINQYTKYLALVFCVVHGLACAYLVQSYKLVINPGPLFVFTTVLSLAAGTMFLVWLGDQINKMGIGQGTSILLSAGILSEMPGSVYRIVRDVRYGTLKIDSLMLFMALFIASLVFVVFFESSQRRIPLVNPRRAVDVGQMQQMYIPIKLNTGGITPVIFANVLSSFVITGVTLCAWLLRWARFSLPTFSISSLTLFQSLLLFVLVVCMSVAYVPIAFSPEETADNLNKQGSFIPGYQPGVKTAEFFSHLIYKISIIGGIYLGIVAVFPSLATSTLFVSQLQFSGTSMLIVANVILETLMQIGTYLVSSKYQSFIKGDKQKVKLLMRRFKRKMS